MSVPLTQALGPMSKFSEWLWSALEPVLGFAAVFITYRLVLWTTAEPIGQLPDNVSLASDCLAFRYDHGLYICEPLGTTQTQPILVAFLLAVIGTCFALSAWIHFSGRSKLNSLVQTLIDRFSNSGRPKP